MKAQRSPKKPPARSVAVPAELQEELRLRLDESLDEQAAGELIDAEEHLAALDAKPQHRRAEWVSSSARS